MSKFSAGFKATQKRYSKPSRVTGYIRPGNPIPGLEGITGAAATETFGKPISRFATRPRQALLAMSRVRGRK